MRGTPLGLLLLWALTALPALAEPPMRHLHGSEGGMVMNANTDTLPHGCAEISREHEFIIGAGRRYAEGIPGMAFGFSQYQLQVQPCSRVSVTLVNEDAIRHQWMVHGLPVYLYPQGMFHIEVNAGGSQRGTFIAPAEQRSYLIHCGMSQHMENGMKAQLVVGRGSGNLWSVKGIGGNFLRADYQSAGRYSALWLLLLTLAVAALTVRWPLRS